MTRDLRVVGSRALAYEGIKALKALESLLSGLGEDSDVAEVRIYENMPIEANVWDPSDSDFVIYVWDFEKWVRRDALS